MFELPVFHTQKNYPWELSLSQRLRMLRQKSRRVAYFYDAPNTSSFRYRGYNMAETINRYIDDVSASWFFASDRQTLLQVAREVEVLVVCRSQFSAELAQLVALARSFGARIIYDTDDLIFDEAYTQTVVQAVDTYNTKNRSSIEATWNHWFATIARHGAAMQLADATMTTNSHLANLAQSYHNVPTYIVPNFMGFDQVEFSQRLVRRKDLLNNQRDGFTDIGYFSGTSTHNKDFAIPASAIARLMRKNPKVRLRLVGFMNVAKTPLAGLEDRILRSPLVSYLELQHLIAKTEINVAPLQVNIFTNCKSELKYFDAGAVRIPTLASPTHTFVNAITSGQNGRIVPEDSWADELFRIVDTYDTDGARMAQAAYEHSYATYTPEANVDAIAGMLEG